MRAAATPAEGVDVGTSTEAIAAFKTDVVARFNTLAAKVLDVVDTPIAGSKCASSLAVPSGEAGKAREGDGVVLVASESVSSESALGSSSAVVCLRELVGNASGHGGKALAGRKRAVPTARAETQPEALLLHFDTLADEVDELLKQDPSENVGAAAVEASSYDGSKLRTGVDSEACGGTSSMSTVQFKANVVDKFKTLAVKVLGVVNKQDGGGCDTRRRRGCAWPAEDCWYFGGTWILWFDRC